jgi:tetratricopeptide (TPR) repeat protein
MSLLMKALEKAAKDRGEANPSPAVTAAAPAATAAGETAAPAAKAARELSLEPLPADTPPQTKAEPLQPNRSGARTARDQARAATVMQATAHAEPAAVPGGRRLRPVIVIGIITAICAVALAIYVYLQITNPGLFISRPPPASTPPLGQAPVSQPAPAPIATSSVVTPATPDETAATARAAEPTPERRQAVKPPAAPAPRTVEAPRDSIRVSAGSAEPQLDPRLTQGYAALQSGNLDAARQAYGDAARSEPRNVNAQLGLAAVAMHEGRADDASRLYFNILDLDPRNAYAQAGLIALMGKADPVSAEARLKQLIAREPLASLYFTLGNLYGDQSRWAEAQQAYFRAHNLEPANPDYAYNLAVGLEHVGQPRLAAGFYQHAVARATAAGRAGFDLAQAQERIRLLASPPQ